MKPVRLLSSAALILFAANCGHDSLTGPSAEQPPTGVNAAVGVDTLTGATLTTDKDDYQPGDSVVVLGRGWAPDEAVQLTLTRNPDNGGVGPVTWNLVADDEGNFDTGFLVALGDMGTTFTLTGTGATSGSAATVIFTDNWFTTIQSFNPAPPTAATSFQVTVQVVTTSGDDWHQTRVRLNRTGYGSNPIYGQCFDHTDHNGSGTYTETFTIPASGTGWDGGQSLAAGQYQIEVLGYDNDASCDSDDAFDSDVTATFTVGGTATNTSLVVDFNPMAPGQQVAYTATVRNSSTNALITSGSVEFRSGGTSCLNGTVLGTGTLGGAGTASYTLDAAEALAMSNGTTVRACYLGSATLAASTGSLTQYVLSVTKLATDQNPGGNADTDPDFYTAATSEFIVTVTSPAGAPTMTSTLFIWDRVPSQLSNNGATVPTFENVSGTWTCPTTETTISGGTTASIQCQTTNDLVAGTSLAIKIKVVPTATGTNIRNRVSAKVGSAPARPSSSASCDALVICEDVDVFILPVPTTTTIASSFNPMAPGQVVTYTAHVVRTSNGANVTSGNVNFRLGGSDCSTGTDLGDDTLDGSGNATYTLSSSEALTVANGAVVRACFEGSSGFDLSNGTMTQYVLSVTKVGTNENPGNADSDPDFYTLGTSEFIVTISNPAGAPTMTSNLVIYDRIPSQLSNNGATAPTFENVTGTWTCPTTETGLANSTAAIRCLTSTDLAAGASLAIKIKVVPTATGTNVVNRISAEVGGDPTRPSSTATCDVLVICELVDILTGPAPSPDAATETTVSGSPDPSKHGQSVTITADVELASSTTAVTVGSVEFRIGGTTCGNGTLLPGGPFALNGSGQASTTRVFTFSEDNSTIRACYLGASGFQTSDGSYSQDVDKADVTVTVTDNPAGTSNVGQSVTFTVTSLPVVAPGAGTPTGNVTFYDGACGTTQIGSPDGTAPYQVTTSALGLGAHTINACYAGDGNFNSNSGSVSHDVTLNATTTAFGTTGGTTGNATGSTNNPSVTGQFTYFSATVTSGGSPVTSGQVEFKKGGTSCTDVAAITLEAVSYTNDAERGPGYHTGPYMFAAATNPSFTVRACYLGTGTYAASAANPTLTQTVNRAATSTTATDTPDPTTFGVTVSFTGSVVITAPGSSNLFPPPSGTVFPTGTVEFWKLQGGQTCANASSPTSISIGSGTLPGDGTATPNVDYANLPASASAHVITACYGGDGNFLPSGTSSGTTQHTVNKATSSLTLTTNTPTVFGDAANFTATMGTNPAGNPTGSVNFYRGGTCDTSTGLGDGTALDITGNTLSGSPATAQGTNSGLNFGANTIVACYGGDGNFTGSTNSATHNVTAAVTQTTLSSATENGAFGDAITLTATVTVPLNATLDPPGSVQFFFNNACSGTSLGSANVNTTTNQAVLTIAAGSTELQNFTVGTHNLRACYTSSSTNYGDSNGGDTHTVTAKSTTTSASTTTTTPQYSDEITLRASVSPASLNGQSQTGVVRFYFGTSAKTCEASDPGAGGSGVIGSDDIVAADNGVSDDALDYQITSAASATAYRLTACFYSSNNNFGDDGGDGGVTVTTEDATITPDAANVNSIVSGTGGTPVGSFQLKFIVKETNPEPDQNAGALFGDLTNVGFGVVLQGVGIPGNNVTGNCGTGVVTGTGYNQIKTYTCTFSNVQVDAYEVVSTVSGSYYDGTDSDALSVYDPNAGFVTGGGKFVFPGTNPAEKVNFGLVFTNPSKKALRGNLLVIRHMANGDICRAKSNGLEAPAIVKDATVATSYNASWAGKGNYNCTRPDGTQYDGSGNLTITGWVQDNGQGSTATGPDKFWVKVSGALNNNLVMPGTGPANAASLTGGNIQVPQPGR